MAALIYAWLAQLTSKLFAALAVLFWILHPSPICYATLLEHTFLSALVTLWLLYELWRLYQDHRLPVWRLALSSVLFFYTRALFQWPFFLLLACSLLLFNVPRQRIVQFLLIVLLLITPYLVKQKILFGTTNTSTNSGYTLCGVIRHQPTEDEVHRAVQSTEFNYPVKAAAFTTPDAGHRNTEEQYWHNLIYTKVFKERLASHPVESLQGMARSFSICVQRYWSASFESTGAWNHLIVSSLPAFWKSFYKFLLAGYGLIVLLFLAAMLLLYAKATEHLLERDWKKLLGFAMPVVFIFLLCNLSNRLNGRDLDFTDPDRFKFFLEPFFFIFIASQIYKLWAMARKGKGR